MTTQVPTIILRENITIGPGVKITLPSNGQLVSNGFNILTVEGFHIEHNISNYDGSHEITSVAGEGPNWVVEDIL